MWGAGGILAVLTVILVLKINLPLYKGFMLKITNK
jgi:hypothetical protein